MSSTHPSALAAFEEAMAAFRTYRGDPVAALDRAIAIDPGFPAAHAAKALVLLTLFERRFVRQAVEALGAAEPLLARATPRERGWVEAARVIAGGDWNGGCRVLDRVLHDHPRDLFALQVAHLFDFCRGDALNLRNRVSRVLPHWSASQPGYSFVLGLHAFGLEECNQYAEAESAGMRALQLAPEDCWAVHAVVHVMEMQGRPQEGLAFLAARRADWAGDDNGFAFHNAWHEALFHLDLAQHEQAIAIYDRVLAGAQAMALSRLDATAMLWRLRLEGADVGNRFEPVAGAWEADLEAEAGFYAFNDFHAAIAFAATGRTRALSRLRDAVESAQRGRGFNAAMSREVGAGAIDGVAAFVDGLYDRAIDHIESVRDIASRFGGSHAQRDILTLTLIEAARRSGRARLAAHYAGERIVHKPGSPWGWRLLQRATPLPSTRQAGAIALAGD